MATEEVLDLLMLPIGILTMVAPLSWPVLWLGGAWLYYRRWKKSDAVPRVALWLWRLIAWAAVSAATSLLALAVATPQGEPYIRVYIALLSSVPLVLPALLCVAVRPTS